MKKRKIINEMLDEIERLKKQRDEARRAYCEQTTRLTEELGCETLTPRQNAEQLGWDCFGKKEKNNQ